MTKQTILDNLEQIKKYLQEIGQEQSVDWVKINNTNCPTLKKYGAKPFKIMKKKMRKPGTDTVWNNIAFSDAQKETQKLGYRLPDIREMLALLEHYRQMTKNPSRTDKEFLGIEELSYNENVCYEWIDVSGCAALRGGNWVNTTDVGPFTLLLYNAPSYVLSYIGFRACQDIKEKHEKNTINSK